MAPLVRIFVSLLTCLVLASCAAAPTRVKPAPDFAAPPRPDGPLAELEGRVRDMHGPDVSGFSLLEHSDRALQWRLALIDSARHSVDLQYYVWFGDTVGKLMMFRAIDAADRGVKVRILFDDLNTMLHDMTHVELRDALLSRVNAHPNIEIRVFNAWRDRSLLGRAFDMASDFQRLNRRMHNKQMIVDNRVAVIGGRNIGDEYFGLNPDFNFYDLDVLGVGPVAREASQVFDRYWNSDWVLGIPDGSVNAPSGMDELGAATHAELLALPTSRTVDAGRRDWSPHLEDLPPRLAPGQSRVHTDSPSRDAATRNHMPEAFREFMRSARQEVLITNAYIIPDANFMNDLAELCARGVSIRILTNSLASHDVPAVNSHFKRWRKPIVQTGAKLHEMRPDAPLRTELVDLPPTDSGFVGLHAKAMVIDRRRAFVGSMNLDPRSEIINSEMGVIIDSPQLAGHLARRMEADMSEANSWAVELDPGGSLVWRSAGDVRTSQPARNFWQRVEDVIFQIFPANLY